MDDWVLLPLRLQVHNLESFEKFFLAFEVGVQRGGQQALAEPARAAEEDERTLLGHLPYQICFVDIDIVFLSQPFKGLDSHGVFADGVHDEWVLSAAKIRFLPLHKFHNLARSILRY